MTRNLRGSLLSPRCWSSCGRRRRRRATGVGPRARHVLLRGVLPTRAPRATTVAGAATARLAGATTTAGMPAARPAIPAGTGTTSAGPATTRAASAGRGPGWASGPAWASAHRVWAGAASAGRRPGWGCGPAWASAAWAGALTVHRFSDHPAGARRPGPTGSLGAVSAAIDGRRGRFPRGRRPVRRFARRPMRPGVTPVAARPSDPVGRTRLVMNRCSTPARYPGSRRGGGEGTLRPIGVNIEPSRPGPRKGS